MTTNFFILLKLQSLRSKFLFGLMLICGALQAQVLQPLGNGLPSRVLAAYASGNEYLALFEEGTTPDTTDYTVARWNGAYWSYYPGLIKPAAVKTVGGYYVYNSVVLYRDTMYAGAYIAGATRDADVDVSHLYKWNGSSWVNDQSVISSKNDGIVAMTVFDGNLIVAGKFRNAVNGKMVDNIAAFDGTTGEWKFLGVSNLEQGTDGTIRSLQVSDNRLYIAGDFQHFAGVFTGNLAYYTASNGGWGGIGSPFSGKVNHLAAYGNKLAALGTNSLGKIEIREFDGTWNAPLNLDTLNVSNPKTIAGAATDLIIGGDFQIRGNGTSIIRFANGKVEATGNRIGGEFNLGQRGNEAFIWGDFVEQNTGLKNISKIESASGDMVGVVYFDKAQNCSKDANDEPLAMVNIRFTNINNGKHWFAVSDSLGRFAAALPEGDYSIRVFAGRHWLNPCTGNYASSIRKGQYSFVSLGQYMQPGISDIELAAEPLLQPVLKPGEEVRVALTIKNAGSSTLNGPTLHLSHDARLTDFSSNLEPDNYTQGEALWVLTDFKPRQQKQIVFNFKLPLNATANDQYLCKLRTGTLFTSGDAYNADNFDTLALKLMQGGNQAQAVVKRSLSGDQVHYKVSALSYHVDFTNTGKSFVKRLVMVDTVDANIPMSRVVITDLFPAEAIVRTEKGNILVVEFPNANLSTLEANPSYSSGYMAYRIELSSDLKPGNFVYNRANGDFDSRWRASSNMVSVMAKDPSADVQNIAGFPGQIWPNPATGKLNVHLNNPVNSNYSIKDLAGKTLLQGHINRGEGSISVQTLPPGVYLLETQAGVGRFVVVR
jgi:hypothetical protein